MSRGWALAVVVALGIVTLRCAWMSDDAYVTLRTLDNFVHGLGLRYNPAERVQGFTHPLWLGALLIPYAITREAWLTPMIVGWAVTMAAAGLLAGRVARDARGAAVGLAALVGSKAAVDYATSGLENPLENLLLVGFAAELFGRARLGVLVLVLALLGTTRLDALLLVAPAIAAVAAERPRREWLGALAGLAPLAVWHAGALVYYGALLPNTAYAKLGTAIPVAELAERSLWSYAWCARVDPLTLPVVAAGIAAGLAARDRRSAALVAGIALQLLWIVRVGGDFMGGRFFVAPLWLAAALLARAPWGPRAAGIAQAATLLAALSPYSPLRSGPGYTKAPPAHGVVDERGYYWQGTGLWSGSTVARGPRHEFARDGRAARGHTPVIVKSVIGLYGYYAGPHTHVVDRLGLTDPFLARLPAQYEPDWRIGHFRRAVPDGYLASVGSGANELVDPQLRALYDAVTLATRAPLTEPGRWRAIGALALGALPVDAAAARYADARWAALDGVEGPVGEGGVGFDTRGARGTAVFTGSSGAWTLVVEAGDARLDRVDGALPLRIPLDGADRIVVFGPPRGRVAGALAP